MAILPRGVAVGFRAATFPWQHPQEKALSPAFFCAVDLGDTSAPRGERQRSFGRGELKTLLCLPGWWFLHFS